jgi:hypothetical protein
MRLVWGTVEAVTVSHEDAQELLVHLDSEADRSDARAALAYTGLSGDCDEGDRVLVNTTAVDLGLGTGGVDLVVARVGPAGPAGVAFDDPSGGHVMKLRYSPLQRDVLAAEEGTSASHEALASATFLDGMPAVCCGLHSQMSLVAAAVKERAPEARVAYVMTDEATLALPMSHLVRASVDAGLIDETVTCGQAFGGRLEAVNAYSGLLVAKHVCRADVAIVAIGPGVAGTGTPFGHGGIAQGQAINAVCGLRGRPIAALRISFADERERHRGVSHHTLTALARVALGPAVVALPALEAEKMDRLEDDLTGAEVWALHERRATTRSPARLPDLRGIRVTTMGRGPEDDPAFFAAAAAAGDVAAGTLEGT